MTTPVPSIFIKYVEQITCYKTIGDEDSIMDFAEARRPPVDKLSDWSAMYLQFCAAHALGTVGYRWDQGYELAQLDVIELANLRVVVVDSAMFATADVSGELKAKLLKQALLEQCDITIADDEPLMSALGAQGLCLACLETESEWELVISPPLLAESIVHQKLTQQYKSKYGATSHVREGSEGVWRRYLDSDEVSRMAEPTPAPAFVAA